MDVRPQIPCPPYVSSMFSQDSHWAHNFHRRSCGCLSLNGLRLQNYSQSGKLLALYRHSLRVSEWMQSSRCVLIQIHRSKGVPAVPNLIWLLDVRVRLCWSPWSLGWHCMVPTHGDVSAAQDGSAFWLLLKLLLSFSETWKIFGSLMIFLEDKLPVHRIGGGSASWSM